MDGQRFDRLTREFASGTSRRSVLRGVVGSAIAGIAAAVGVGKARAGNECADFCHQLPPGKRGNCVSECQHGGGLYAECEGDINRLCIAGDGTATCCAEGSGCIDGTCGCGDLSAYCEATHSCVYSYCIDRYVYDPESCQCECAEGFERMEAGGCGIPCETDGDCASWEHCGVTASGDQHFCVDSSYLIHCTPCETDFDCYHGCSINKGFCDQGVCRQAS
jgi:hypothetical protein